MTKEQLDQQINEIKQTLGEPEFDFDRTPLNESAKKIKELRAVFQSEQKKKDWEEKKALKNFLSPDELRQTKDLPAPPIYLEDHDLKGFTAVEAAIIEAHFENRNLNQQQLAKQFGVERQTITALFHNQRFNMLRIKYFDNEMPSELRLALAKLVKAGDQKTVLRLAEHYQMIKAEKQELNIVSKPIEDPEALKMLRDIARKRLDSEDKTDA